MATTTSSDGKVKITYWGGKWSEIEGADKMAGEPEAKRMKSEVDHVADEEESSPKHTPIKEETNHQAEVKPQTPAPEIPKRRSPGGRLWHEPPILDFSNNECYNQVERELKEMGGAELWERTCFLDFVIEVELLDDSRVWIRHFSKFDTLSEAERQFYMGLAEELMIDQQKALNEYWHNYPLTTKEDQTKYTAMEAVVMGTIRAVRDRQNTSEGKVVHRT